MGLLMALTALVPLKNTKFCRAYQDSALNMIPAVVQIYGEVNTTLQGAFKGERIAFVDYQLDSLFTMQGYMFGISTGHTRVYVHPRRFSNLPLPERRIIKLFSDYIIAYARDPLTFCIFRITIE